MISTTSERRRLYFFLVSTSLRVLILSFSLSLPFPSHDVSRILRSQELPRHHQSVMYRLVLVAAALACARAQSPPPSSQVYKLDWLGTYDSCAYSKDAAESIGCAPNIQAAIVGNADIGGLDFISISDFTNPTKTSTINVLGTLLTDAGKS